MLVKIVFVTFLSIATSTVDATSKNPLLTAYTEILYPISYKDSETQEFKGEATEVLRRVMAEAGLEFEIKLHSWARSYEKVLNTPNTLLYSVARMPEREDDFVWLQKITTLNYGLYTTEKEKSNLTLEQARTAPITVTRNGISHLTLVDHGFNNFIFINDHDRISQLVDRDRINIIFTSSFWYAANKSEFSKPLYKLKNIDLSVSDVDLYIVINKNTRSDIITRLKKSFNKVLNGKDIVSHDAPSK